MATKYEDEKNKTAAKASAAPSAAAQAAKMSVANEAARLAAKKPVQEKAWVHQPLGKVLPKAFDAAMAGIKKIGGGALAPYQTPVSRVDGYTAVGPGRISEGTRTGVYTLSDNGNIPGPRVENKPGYTDRKAPVGIGADPTNQQTPASIAAQKAAQPGQNSQSPTGNRYLDMATYGRNPLMDNLTMPATEENKKRFMEMGGIQTIRGTMKPDERPSVGWWNPNTLREHATIGEGMMGVDYPVAAQRYEVDAPIQGEIAKEDIKAAAGVATAQPKSPWEFKTIKVPDPDNPLAEKEQGMWVNSQTQEIRPAEPSSDPVASREAERIAQLPMEEMDAELGKIKDSALREKILNELARFAQTGQIASGR